MALQDSNLRPVGAEDERLIHLATRTLACAAQDVLILRSEAHV